MTPNSVTDFPLPLTLQSPSLVALRTRSPVIFLLSKNWFPEFGFPLFELRGSCCLWMLSRWQLLWVPTPTRGRTGKMYISPFCARCVLEKTHILVAESPKKSTRRNTKSVPGHSVFCWCPRARMCFKKTKGCQTCCKLKNICQTCLLDQSSDSQPFFWPCPT